MLSLFKESLSVVDGFCFFYSRFSVLWVLYNNLCLYNNYLTLLTTFFMFITVIYTHC